MKSDSRRGDINGSGTEPLRILRQDKLRANFVSLCSFCVAALPYSVCGVDLLAIPASLRFISEPDATLLAAFELLCMVFSS